MFSVKETVGIKETKVFLFTIDIPIFVIQLTAIT